MPDFPWTEQHTLIPRRQATQVALAEAGYVFAARPLKLEPGGRPRSIGATADGRARIAASLPALADQPLIKAQFDELHFDLRLTRDGKRLILGMTWQA